MFLHLRTHHASDRVYYLFSSKSQTNPPESVHDMDKNSHKSKSGSFQFRRRSLKRSTTAPQPPPPPQGQRHADHDNDDDNDTTHDHSRSLISEPALSKKFTAPSGDTWAQVPLPMIRAHYKLHNPLGPRWYKNHHLIPPSHAKPSMRPPTFFSPSFPPIATSASREREREREEYLEEQQQQHDNAGEGPSRRTSASPLPTPSSSQVRVQEGPSVGGTNRPRSRKGSQTAPDAIDLMDVTDPWGQNWHHQSPYEFGQTTTVALFDHHDVSFILSNGNDGSYPSS